MSNQNTSIVIETVSIVLNTTTVALTYTPPGGGVTKITGGGTSTNTYSLASAPSQAGWSITGWQPVGTIPADFDQTAPSITNGSLVITDNATASDSFSFKIQLTKGGVVYTSTDPVDSNQPPASSQ